MIAVIKSESQYTEVLDRVTQLAIADPIPDSDEGRELEVLSVLLKDYERREYGEPVTSPLAAIRSRMDQMDLAPKDLVPYLGSRSKVSEVLAGKRPLSLSMIRSLHTGLGIPLSSLISDEPDDESLDSIDWDRFPVKEMIKRGWLRTSQQGQRARIGFAEAKELMEGLFAGPGSGGLALARGILTKSDRVRSAQSTDRYALAAWVAYVRHITAARHVSRKYSVADWGVSGFRELRSLSRFRVGPQLAIQYLEERGIIVTILPHLPRTRLDGAAMLRQDGTPIIAMTLRHDRLDNFWFTLFHELMHVVLHLRRTGEQSSETSCFVDDLEIVQGLSAIEQEADDHARQALIPDDAWAASAVRYAIAPATVAQLALEVGVSEAIVAGRVRRERNNYRLLSGMIGAGDVRCLFPDVKWDSGS